MSENSSIAPPPSSGDRLRWFNDEVHAHDSHLKAYVRRSFPSVRDVDDLVQECYLRIWREKEVRPVRSTRGFLFTAARRLALTFLRREKFLAKVQVTGLDPSFVVDSGRNGAEAAAHHQEVDLLVEAIEALPARCREILVMRRLQGVSQKEIAAKLGLSENTVQVQAARGLRKVEAYVRDRVDARK